LFPGSLEINNSIVLIGNLETILEVDEEDAFEDCEDDVVQLQTSIVVQPTNDFTVNFTSNSQRLKNADGYCGDHRR
jgi:hypothetical protein